MNVFNAFVDEVGDRGLGPKSSPFFCFCAVVVREQNLGSVGNALDQVCVAGKRAPESVVKFRDLDHYQKRLASELLGALPLRLIYVIVPKATTPLTSGMATDHRKFYNFAARLVLERISWLAHEHNGVAHVTFEKVKGFSTLILTDYITRLRTQTAPGTRVEWSALGHRIRVAGPAEIRPLCAADIGAGAMDAAIRPEARTGLLEPAYLENLAPRIWRTKQDHVLQRGIKVLGSETTVTDLPWWPVLFPKDGRA